jgi:DNA helicase-2/ATP-dependent DNA helicase PcrA
VRALSDKFQNICVVGDDAQSIYAFLSGANINNILNFQKDYEGENFQIGTKLPIDKTSWKRTNTIMKIKLNWIKLFDC